MRRFFSFLIILNVVLLIGIGVYFFKNKGSVSLYCDNIELKRYVSPLVDAIQKSNIFNGKKVGFYVANFWENDNIVLPQKDDVSIIWLGGRSGIDTELLKEYDYVFASSYSLRDFLIKNKIRAYYLPLISPDDKIVKKVNSNRLFGIVGKHPIIEKILNEKGIEFKRYSLDNIYELENDIDRLDVVFANDTNFFKNNLDLHPIFYKLIRNKIIIISKWTWPNREMLKLFNSTINFYKEEQDARIVIDEVLALDKIIIDRKEEAYNLVMRFFSFNTNIKRVFEVFKRNKEYDEGYEKGSVNIDVVVSVGHISGGDFWLALDLLDLFDNKYFTNKRVTYLDSFIKYKSEYNLLVCGILPIGKNDYIGNKNILYIAYPSFEDNLGVETIKDTQDYINDIKNKIREGNGIDVVISASHSFTEELKKSGIEAYYIPQFTNSDKFYPDFREELKSDVFFVGVNTHYRKAWKYLLEEGIDVTIYGPYYPEGISKGDYLDNRLLGKYYSSAKIVLNDTRDGMKKYGFIGNRIFDASASGALVISDYMKEIEDIYGDSVVMWKTKEELVEKVKYYLNPKNDEERKEKANRAREITLKHFTKKAVIPLFKDVIDKVSNKI